MKSECANSCTSGKDAFAAASTRGRCSAAADDSSAYAASCRPPSFDIVHGASPRVGTATDERSAPSALSVPPLSLSRARTLRCVEHNDNNSIPNEKRSPKSAREWRMV